MYTHTHTHTQSIINLKTLDALEQTCAYVKPREGKIHQNTLDHISRKQRGEEGRLFSVHRVYIYIWYTVKASCTLQWAESILRVKWIEIEFFCLPSLQWSVLWWAGNSSVWKWQDLKWTRASLCVGERTECWLWGTRPPWRDSTFIYVCVCVCVRARAQQWQRGQKMLNYWIDIYTLLNFYSTSEFSFWNTSKAPLHQTTTRGNSTTVLFKAPEILKPGGSKLQTARSYLPTQLVRDTRHQTMEKRGERQQISHCWVQLSVDRVLTHCCSGDNLSEFCTAHSMLLHYCVFSWCYHTY